MLNEGRAGLATSALHPLRRDRYALDVFRGHVGVGAEVIPPARFIVPAVVPRVIRLRGEEVG